MTPFQNPQLELPWQSSVDEDRRFKRILRGLVIVGLLIGLIVPFVPVPELTREDQATLPPQLARIILEEEPPPPPPEPEPEPTPEPEPQVEPEAEPEVVVEPEPAPEPEPTPTQIQQARETAAASGLLRHREDLMAMQETLQMAPIESETLAQGSTEAAQVDRSVITRQAEGDSGGIDTAALSRDAGETALAGRDTTQVESDLDARQAQEEQAAASEPERVTRRSDEEIRRVIDQHLGAIFSIYNRALRQNPALQGKVVVYLVIEPDGQISEVRIDSSELNDASLESRILARIQLITFASARVAQAEVSYTFDFLPQ
ncbi:AgmX/PglI C-terminal domain-containing protein [Marinimicrobium sp. ABcell2]|uniref:AgmX/PglI C-terminal domain-containing protein n=1 Tax=Marinimicrobium sp. ABcell2 TaxID=3069751 RepID=UPI0027B207D6|nr:AgmX/PglI C-terminal domain-containing protein [Marinimicrobium sp. ABcell2]MDQ2076643.1 AgmX/PglI C-terminal domain-containing protein [Marinimicrobium sp. ABcell2]